MQIVKVDLTQLVTVSGTTNLHQAVTSGVTIYWRRYSFDGVSTFTYEEQFLGTDNGGGNWWAEVPDGFYQCWKSAFPDTTAGNRINKWHGGATKYKWVGDEDLPYMPLVDDTPDYYNAGNLQIKNLDDADDDTDALPKGQADDLYQPVGSYYTQTQINTLLADYIKKIAGVTEAFLNQIVFRDYVPYINQTPSNLRHAATVGFVKNYVQEYLTGEATNPYQQSENVLRVIPSGVAEPNKVFRTLGAAIVNAESFAASDHVMIIEIQGDGIDGAVDADHNLLTVGTADPYVHIVGKSAGIVIRVAEDTYTGTFEGNIYENLIFDNEAEDAGTNFTNKVFINCKFTNSFGSGTPTYTFNTCRFIGCVFTGVTPSFTTCTGFAYDSTNSKVILLGGLKVSTFDIIESDGDVKPRRLQGRQAADIASASSITIGDGNFAVVTGTTTIATISTTGWDDGSIISLYFSGSLTLDAGGGNLAHVGGNVSVTAGQVKQFLKDSSSWIILD